MIVTLGQHYNVGEKPTVILYTYINRHAGTPSKKQKQNRNNVVHHSPVLSTCPLHTNTVVDVGNKGILIGQW